MKYKVAYIHGRPAAHPMHVKFAKSVDADFHFVDFKMRWQDKNKSVLYRAVSWIVCAFSFPSKKKYDIFLVDNLHFFPVLMKVFGLLGKKQKIVVHLGSHTLYFMYARRFSKLNLWLHKQALKRYDALICEGKMAEDLAKKILGKETPPTYTVINGISKEHFPDSETRLPLNNKNILFMGHGPGENRLWYKGLDLMIDAFKKAFAKDKELIFTIVGNWDEAPIAKLLESCNEETKKAIHFVGPSSNLKEYVLANSLYMHCARGEAFGLTILIAMAHGLPAFVSECTGAKELVEKVDEKLVLPLDPDVMAEKILWYFNLPAHSKKELSDKSRKIAQTYTEEYAVEFHKQTFEAMVRNFEILT